jgi:hypothetical protein
MTRTIGPNLRLNEGGNRLTQTLVAKLPVFRPYRELAECRLLPTWNRGQRQADERGEKH